ncbi:MAG: alpha/beta hydrolase [Candidatus Zixiibacteriota bacterium]|jgi:acetyl esterase/lipase
MKNVRGFLGFAILISALAAPAGAQYGADIDGLSDNEKAFGYTLTVDVPYGKGKVTTDGKVVERDLLMDVYEPVDGPAVGRPAVVLIHGGAFHRGGPRRPPYREMGAVHSRMEDYARLLTPQGYVCFVVSYRLIPENPVPDMSSDAEGLQTYNELITDAGLARTNLVRGFMGLPLVSEANLQVLWNGVLSAAEDINKAISHVRDSAEEYGIDPERVAVGGHSAGATTTLNAVYGLKAPVAAIFPLSPAVSGFDMKKAVDSPELPPMLLVVSQNDEPAVAETIPPFITAVREAGLDYEFAWVPGYGHFYPSGAVSLGDDGLRMSVGERIAAFLETNLK